MFAQPAMDNLRSLPSLLYLLFLLLLTPRSVLGRVAYRGVDWSSAIVEEELQGLRYKFANGTAAPLETILAAAGVNSVRQRIWVTPADSGTGSRSSGGNNTYGVEYNLRLARRARAVGLSVYLDFHYSDTWADPGHQRIPAGWPSEVGALEKKVYDYTRQVCEAFAKEKIAVELVSIGNEITAGLLWPTGNVNSGGGFPGAARLLKAAARAVRESGLTAGDGPASSTASSSSSSRPQIMIHLDNGWKWDTQKWWYSSLLSASSPSSSPFAAADFDILAVSYYPFYNAQATLANLRTSLANMAAAHPDKKLLVAETNWPESCPRPRYSFPSDIAPPRIPLSADGQAMFVKEVAKVVEGVPGGRGLGVFYWEPAWVHNAGLGSSCADNTMFEQNGRARSSLGVFGTI